MSGTSCRFETTRWSRIIRARASEANFAELLGLYRAPVFAMLRRHGHSNETADDITQTFMAKVIADRKLINRADPSLGRFRSFVRKVVVNCAKDWVAQQQRQSAAALVFPDAANVAALHAIEDDDFDCDWARRTLQIVLERTRASYEGRGKRERWEVFEARVLNHLIYGVEKTPVAELARKLNCTEDNIYDITRRARELALNLLQEVVAETVEDVAEVQAEIDYLLRCLAPN